MKTKYAASKKNPIKIFAFILVAGLFATCQGAQFQSDWQNCHDRVWIGAEYWANPMEDWQINNGRLECTSPGGDRNVHILTYQMQEDGDLLMSVRLGLIKQGATGSAGFQIGIRDDVNDYRGNCLWGKGVNAGITVDGHLVLDAKKEMLENFTLKDLILNLEIKLAQQDKQTVLLTVTDAATKKVLGGITGEIEASRLIGNLAVSNNFGLKVKNGSRFWFSDWKIGGAKVIENKQRAFGPILWAMHTLSNSRGSEGHVMKMTAQMPPMGEMDNQIVQLQIQEKKNAWKSLGSEKIDSDARMATFRIPNWPAEKDVPYRLVYTMKTKDQKSQAHYWTGTVRKDPVNRPLVIAGFTGNQDYVFPNKEIVCNVKIQDPDMLFFSGDQIYETVGGYGIIRTPADRSILNYLRKWYLLGWAFGDLMRDRVTICLPDDHDVYQGNIWGQGGRDCGGIKNHAAGGYAQPVKMVNAVHRTQTSHHPDFCDATPIDQGMSVFYGDMVYGRISFAIIADRMFKSGPKGKVNDWKGRPDHCKDPDYDIHKLDKPRLQLLGDRQHEFLNTWVEDWRGSDMKIVLSQTIFCNLANYHGPGKEFVLADLDSNGWPQTGRNKALDVMRRAFAFHLAGDQHLASIVHHGIDSHRDAGWSFCVPSIAAGYPRSWLPDKEGYPIKNRPAAGLANTGDYLDGFGNHVTVYAVGNPAEKNRKGRAKTAHDKASGYGIVRMDQTERTITMECWRLLFDAENPKPEDQFPGFPHTISQTDNDGRKNVGYLDEVKYKGISNPVVQVFDKNDELVYALRLRPKHFGSSASFKPWVFEPGTYTVRIGDPDKQTWEVYTRTKSTE